LGKNISVPFMIAHSCISVRTFFPYHMGENIY
jgi:hypothetical protein